MQLLPHIKQDKISGSDIQTISMRKSSTRGAIKIPVKANPDCQLDCIRNHLKPKILLGIFLVRLFEAAVWQVHYH